MKKGNKILAYLLITPALITIFSVVIFPIIYSFRLSFFKWDMLKTSSQLFVGLDNYIKIFGDSNFYNGLKITIIYCMVVVPLEFLIGLGLALILDNDRIKGMRIINTILLSPMVVAPVAIGTTWRMLYQTDIGVVNALLSIFFRNHTLPIWLADAKFALASVMFVDIWQTTPFFMLLMIAGLKSMPTEPFESARVDGASNWQCFRYLTLNFLKPVILIGFIFRSVDAFREFDKIIMLTKGGPAGRTENLSLFVYRVAFTGYHFGYAAALSIVMMIMSGFIAWSFIRAIKFNI